MTIIGENIKSARKVADLTLEELAKIVGVTKQTIQKYESGIIANIPSDKIEFIANALKTTPAALMGWESNNSIDIRTMSATELDIIKKYRLLDARGQAAVQDTLQREYDYLNKEIEVPYAARGGGKQTMKTTQAEEDELWRRIQVSKPPKDL